MLLLEITINPDSLEVIIIQDSTKQNKNIIIKFDIMKYYKKYEYLAYCNN